MDQEEMTNNQTLKTKSLHRSKPYYTEQGGRLGRRAHVKIMNHYLEYIQSRLLDGHEVYLPYIGKFQVVGDKFRPDKPGANINWPESKKMWAEYPELKGKQFVLYLNEHTNGYWFGLQWTKAKLIRNIRGYKFSTVATFRQKLSKRIHDGQQYVNKKDNF